MKQPLTLSNEINVYLKSIWRVISPFTGTHEPNKLTCSQLSGFIAQLVEQWTFCHLEAMLVKDNRVRTPSLVDVFGSQFRGRKTNVFSPLGLKMVAM